jgi:hypothetical protein
MFSFLDPLGPSYCLYLYKTKQQTQPHLNPERYWESKFKIWDQVLLESEEFWRWCITLTITGFLDFFHCPEFWMLETQRFGNWVCLRSQVKGRETATQLAPLERAILNHWTIGIWGPVIEGSSLLLCLLERSNLNHYMIGNWSTVDGVSTLSL